MQFLPSREGEPGLRMGTAAGRCVILAAVLGSGLSFLDGTVVNAALPAIAHDLGADLGDLQWVLTGLAAVGGVLAFVAVREGAAVQAVARADANTPCYDVGVRVDPGETKLRRGKRAFTGA